eukprot:6205736-Pleurochrysis_carterae.AAC.2
MDRNYYLRAVSPALVLRWVAKPTRVMLPALFLSHVHSYSVKHFAPKQVGRYFVPENRGFAESATIAVVHNCWSSCAAVSYLHIICDLYEHGLIVNFSAKLWLLLYMSSCNLCQ